MTRKNAKELIALDVNSDEFVALYDAALTDNAARDAELNKLAAQALRDSLNRNAQARAAYEREEQSSKSQVVAKMIAALKLDHKTLETKLSDSFFERLAASRFVDSYDFVNNHAKTNQRYNIYAIQKAQAKIESIVADKLLNRNALTQKFCVAIVLTCLQNRERESFSFDRKSALSMLSRAFSYEHVQRSDFAQQFNVTENTASTQVSSSFRALEALHILDFDDSRNVVLSVNYANRFVQLVQEHFAIQ